MYFAHMQLLYTRLVYWDLSCEISDSIRSEPSWGHLLPWASQSPACITELCLNCFLIHSCWAATMYLL